MFINKVRAGDVIEQLQQALRQPLGIALIINQQGKFIAAESGGAVNRIMPGMQTGADMLQDLIAHSKPQAVIDCAKPIQVDQHKGIGIQRLHGLLIQALDLLIKLHTRHQPSEFIKMMCIVGCTVLCT